MSTPLLAQMMIVLKFIETYLCLECLRQYPLVYASYILNLRNCLFNKDPLGRVEVLLIINDFVCSHLLCHIMNLVLYVIGQILG